MIKTSVFQIDIQDVETMFFETNGTIPFFSEKLLAVSQMKLDSQNINWEDKSLGHETPNFFFLRL